MHFIVHPREMYRISNLCTIAPVVYTFDFHEQAQINRVSCFQFLQLGQYEITL